MWKLRVWGGEEEEGREGWEIGEGRVYRGEEETRKKGEERKDGEERGKKRGYITIYILK